MHSFVIALTAGVIYFVLVLLFRWNPWSLRAFVTFAVINNSMVFMYRNYIDSSADTRMTVPIWMLGVVLHVALLYVVRVIFISNKDNDNDILSADDAPHA